ncbi:MAG: hypothetical protein A4E67_02550 [Syntrophaceae bacterium PtaB.Bin038]|nr:MAG: hypothetical protein A4E67_02550 [Syntrophaceae bacterium PtaB.Bin038]
MAPTAAAVAGPIVQMRTPLRSRMSPPLSRSLAKKCFTPFALVKTIQSYPSRPARARSMSPQFAGGAMRIVGKRIASAPSAASSRANSPACSSGLVTTMPFPNRGLASNQSSLGRSATTSPTTRMDGGLNPCFFAFAAMSASVPVSVCCSGVVPHRMSAAGVSGAFPPSTRFRAMFARFLTPMRKTRVPIPASAPQSISLLSFVGSSWPVTKATVEV